MTLTVDIQGDQANIMRGNVEVGVIRLDHHSQISGVCVHAVATFPEEELIIRLAASHVAQYVVNREVKQIHYGVLRETRTLEPIPGSTPARSIELLDFRMIPPEHAKLTVIELESGLQMAGVNITKRYA